MEEEKNTAAAVDWEEAPNPKHRKRSRKKEPAANAPRPAEIFTAATGITRSPWPWQGATGPPRRMPSAL